MDEALLALLEKKEFAYITIRELCAAAGGNHSTFYLHYQKYNGAAGGKHRLYEPAVLRVLSAEA